METPEEIVGKRTEWGVGILGEAKQKQKPRRNNNNLWIVGGAVVIAVATMIGLSIYLANKNQAPEPTETAGTTVTPIAAKTDAEVKGNRNQQGNPAAKVEVVEWGDYL
ncbi:MAG: hypothetical protein K0R39_3932 [Symbiobacteriaceae bacterium]|nr:hypothetical protein [Symbiobacteriaceae bacterium]